MNMEVTIIIVNYNTTDLLKNCLKSIFEYAPKVKYDVVVVDNNSKDGWVKYLEEKFPLVKVICLKKNLGFSTAVNRALMKCETDFALLLNPDAELFPGRHA